MEHNASTDQVRRIAVLTVSDSVSRGRNQDTSGDVIQERLETAGFQVAERHCVPDERAEIAAQLRAWASDPAIAGIVTTGGTGIALRDVTPEATRDVIEKELPGMAEAMRAKSLQKTPFAMVSRQVVGVANGTLVVNLPGSPKAVAECLEVILPVFNHLFNLLAGHTRHDTPPGGP
ncbi:MAG: MogA/MoaB family molybdenum cofactor biosynthesis protein [Alicyclobacillus sp.]|nr:MogA/MoaB family molybdenum cofactor biosynthesis protein [Alicyclobacillus sp.]